MKLEIITTKGVLYDKCENAEQLYDNFYFPLLVEFKELQKQNKELKDNWNKLKEWAKDGHKNSLLPYYECGLEYEDVLDEMQEIEGGMNDRRF